MSLRHTIKISLHSILSAKLSGAIGLVSIFYGINIVLGLGRDMILSATFGATKQLDAFLLGMSFVRVNGLLISAAIANALIPVFVDIITKKKYEIALAFIMRGLRDLSIALVILAIAVIGLATPLAKLLGPGLDANGQSILIHTLQGLAPLFLILGLSGLTKTVADSTGRYISHPVLLLSMTAGLIGCVAFFHRSLGIRSAIIGMVGGALIGLLVQLFIIAWKRNNLISQYFQQIWEHKFAIWHIPGSSLPYYSILILLVSSFVTQAQGIIERRYVSYLPAGTMVSLSLALSVLGIPTALLLPAISSVLLPHFVRQEHNNDGSDYGLSLLQYGALILTFIMVTIVYWLGGNFMIHILFYRGAFSESAVISTVKILRLLSLSLTPYILAVIFRQVLLAKKMLIADLAVITIVLLIKLFLLQLFVVHYGIDAIIAIMIFGSLFSALLYFGIIQYLKKHTIGINE